MLKKKSENNRMEEIGLVTPTQNLQIRYTAVLLSHLSQGSTLSQGQVDFNRIFYFPYD